MPRISRISEREWKVLALVAKGFHNDEIATQLDISVSSVKTAINRLFAMFDAANRAELVGCTAELGILDEAFERWAQVSAHPAKPPKP